MAKGKNPNYDKNRPKYEWGSGWESREVSAKQVAYIEALARKAGVRIQNLDQMKRGGASGLIDELKRAADGDPHSRRYLIRDWSNYVIMEA